MAIHYHGLLRLAGHFGPVMRARGADGAHGAAAWVNLLSAYAWVNNPALGTYSASQAAALSLSHCLRAELRRGRRARGQRLSSARSRTSGTSSPPRPSSTPRPPRAASSPG